MSSTRQRNRPGSAGEVALPAGIIGLVLLVVGGPWAAMSLASRFTHAPAPEANPFASFFQLVRGQIEWTTAATFAAVALGLAGVFMLVLVLVLRSRLRGGRGRAQSVDRAAQHMGRGRDVESLSRRAASDTAVRLGADKDQLGLPLGRAVATNQPLWSNWENTIVDVWGTRTGKTTSMGIPSIMSAPGACVVTSNKRDIVDATRDPRAGRGTVWVFDPQGIVGEEATWWWNPLSYVTDENRASELAGHFAAAARDEGSRSDPFWEDSGEDLLAGCLLAAAVAGKPISTVYQWLVTTSDETPARILEDRYPMIAARLQGFVNAPSDTRGGIYSNAQSMARCLTNSQVLRWIEPPERWQGRQEFSPDEFVRSQQTLYSLSMEGRGTAGAIVTALTAAVIDAAVEYATEQPGGRLATPMVAVLDEAANVCRWAQLPNLYSHFGSRGIVLRTILQGWSQGVQVWGQAGMRKLWSSANVKTYGGGVTETDFLRDLSELIGDYDRPSVSVSQSQGRRSVSRDLRAERILDVADLASLPKGRAVVLASGARPTLVRTVPWMESPYADAVKASIQAHDPQARATLTEASHELSAVRSLDAQLGGGSEPDRRMVQW